MERLKNPEDLKKILEENKKVLIEFYAPWCGHCRSIKRPFKNLDQKLKDVKFIKFNIDDCKDICQLYGIRSLPTFLYFKDGKIHSTHIGFTQEKDLEDIVL